MAFGYGQPAPKPSKTRKQLKARADRAEVKIMKAVRAECVLRDGSCRVWRDVLSRSICDQRVFMVNCEGRAEWAHLEDRRRAKTRGMTPEARHTTTGTMMLCTVHHQQYDARRLKIRFLSNVGADGEVEFYV